jgi:L-tyrosine isonitrile synthase
MKLTFRNLLIIINKSLIPGREAMSRSVAYLASNLATISFAQNHEAQTVTVNCGPSARSEDRSTSDAGKKIKRRVPAKPGNRTGAEGIRATAEKVLRAFNTWAFKREQPSDVQLMLDTLSEAVAARAAIRFVLYWGKGPRHAVGAPDLQCLDFLAAVAARVKGVHAPGAAITLLLTDTHAELNGYCRQDIDRYFDEVKAAAQQRGFETRSLDQLVKAAGNLATAVPLDDTVPAEMLSSLTTSAAKWYRGAGTPEDGALTYLRMNLIEQRVVERAFPGSIFITFNGSDLRKLFPRQLPIFYMYSLRRGFSVKPWFMSGESTKPGSTADQANPIHPDAA